MHPTVEPYARDVAEKQEAFFEAHRRLEESARRFLSADPSDMSYYRISDEHSQIFKEWIARKRALEEAVREMHRVALKAANIPEDHPLWKLAGP